MSKPLSWYVYSISSFIIYVSNCCLRYKQSLLVFYSSFCFELQKNIVIAGTDTAAAAVVWGMTYLMKYPEVMKKAQAEVRGYVKERRLTFVTEDDVKNLPY